MENKNEITITFDSYSVNEGFARMAAAAFLTEFNPTLDEIEDVKTAISEAVTNAVIHGYEGTIGKVTLHFKRKGQEVEIIVEDHGKGIVDIEKAKQPFYTTKPELERSGMGFAFMEAFMDELSVESAPGKGTVVFMKKKWNQADEERADA